MRGREQGRRGAEFRRRQGRAVYIPDLGAFQQHPDEISRQRSALFLALGAFSSITAGSCAAFSCSRGQHCPVEQMHL
jgi:hypothetical protein